MINPIRFNYTFCNSCNSVHGLECYDISNRPINYSLLIQMFNQGKTISQILDKKELAYFKCRKCGEYYRISWNLLNFPVPLRYEFPVEVFIRDFNK